VKLPRRQFLHLAASAAALPAVSHIAWAQAYPSRPVRMILGYAPGSAPDIVARLIGQWLSERLGQQFVIENRPGAGSNIATEAVVRAAADGYLVTAANAMNATLYEKLSFNFIRDIAPVAGIIVVPNVMVANPSVPAKTVPEFIAYAKANPGKINMASGPIGGPSQVSGELFKMMTGTDMLLVAYRENLARTWSAWMSTTKTSRTSARSRILIDAKRPKRLYCRCWRVSRDGRSLCCRAPVGNQLQYQGRQMDMQQ
jgi:tripartite-type tricarboxylate transporter receptor subunit TctC